MGAGSFSEGEIRLLIPDEDPPQQTRDIGVFTIIVVAEKDYSLNLDELFETGFSIDAFRWVQSFGDLQQALLAATDLQLGIRIYLSDDSWGLGQAEFVLHASNDSPAYATNGLFGRFGEAVHLFGDGAPRHTMVHEFGHHAWGLGDEYTAEVLSDPIDTDADFIDRATIPLISAQHTPEQIVAANAILKFGQRLERIEVVSYDPFTTPPRVTVASPFSEDPRTAESAYVFYQRYLGYGCSGSENSRFSLMEADGVDDGALKTDFCVAENHDKEIAGAAEPDDTNHTAQFLDSGLEDASCWGVIRHVMDNRFDYPIEQKDPGTILNFIIVEDDEQDMVEFLPLIKEARVVLVMDRSGSMASAGKIQGARTGVEYWLNSLAQSNEDYLSLLWYNDEVHEQLELDQHDLDDEIVGDLQSVQPQGFTNILGALEAAREQINSRDGRAAIQAVILLTDGVHNRPVGTLATDVIPEYQQDGIQIISVALGGPESVDYETLEELSADTGGTVIRVDGGGSQAITAGLSEAEGVLRNGLVASGQVEAAPAPKVVQAAVEDRKLPHVEDFVKLYGLDSLSSLLSDPPPSIAVVPFHLDQGAQRAKLSLAYPEGQRLWLYLIDPDGAVAELDGDEIRLINPESPFTLAIVNKPKAGWWRALVFGVRGASPVTSHYVAFSENRSVVVSAGCDPVVALGDGVDLRAGASYGDRLSGLHVTAEVISPNGVVSSTTLGDTAAGEIGTGNYGGRFTPTVAGPHHCRFRLVSNGKAERAGAIHRALHAGRKADKISLAAKVPPFHRIVDLYFDVGARPAAKDADRRRPRQRRPGKPTRLDFRRFKDRLAKISQSKS